MPTDEALLQQAQDWKSQGNTIFGEKNGVLSDAINAYSQGLVAVDRIVTTPLSSMPTASSLKATLLSNRAMCHLKAASFDACVQDCTSALTVLDNGPSSSGPEQEKLRQKLLFRRAKARFLKENVTTTMRKGLKVSSSSTSSSSSEALQEAAKDLLRLLQQDPHNKEAQQLLTALRAQHQQAQPWTPIRQTLEALQQALDDGNDDDNNVISNQTTTTTTTITDKTQSEVQHQLKLLLGLLNNDVAHASMEMGRLEGVPLLLRVAAQNVSATTTSISAVKSAQLALQCLSQAGSHPAFCRQYLVHHQKDLRNLVVVDDDSYNSNNNDGHGAAVTSEVVVSVMAVYVRLVLHVDRDDPNQDIDGKTLIEYDTLLLLLVTSLARFGGSNANNAGVVVDANVVRATLDLLTTWTAGVDRDATIRQSLPSATADPTLPLPPTPADLRSMAPRAFSHHRQRASQLETRDKAWAWERSMLFLRGNNETTATRGSTGTRATTGLATLLRAICATDDHVLRREMTVVLGRLLALEEDEDKVKDIVRSYLHDEEREKMGVIIEEVYNDDQEEKTQQVLEEEQVVTLQTKMQRAAITTALLWSKKEVGAWCLGGNGWKTSDDELPALMTCGQPIAMCLAAEVVAAAATVPSARPVMMSLVTSKAMEALLTSPDRDIRSGAASAVAKLGMSEKEMQADEGNMMGMLQAACDLLEDDEKEQPDQAKKTTMQAAADHPKMRHFSSFATSSVERAIEMISYLVANTIVKDELAAGFKPRHDSHQTALERLVKNTDIPNAGESLSGFALASIFQHLAVTNLQLRKEGFEGKEVTMEQYDEMQKLGKTEEEKEVMESQTDPDTQAACDERIRKMASANVPRAIVSLMEGASEHTIEQLTLCMNRMAGEPAARGVMIQQGVLSACIKMEKNNDGAVETETMKKAMRHARHSIAKMLITTNPTLLTSAQRLGSVKPLIQLVRDSNASDLQQFEALLSLTNIASAGDDAKNRIVSESGIATFNFAMFSDHEMVRRAATEAMSNLIPHKKMMEFMAEKQNLKLWLAFATDYEENYECARAATGCLAMATQDESIAKLLVEVEKFRPEMEALLESGRLEIMHRALVLILNLVLHGGDCRKKAVSEGLVAFCNAYAGTEASEGLEFSNEEVALLPITKELAKKVVLAADE